MVLGNGRFIFKVECFRSLIPDLLNIIKMEDEDITIKNVPTLIMNRQLALLAFRFLIRILSSKYPDDFKEVWKYNSVMIIRSLGVWCLEIPFYPTYNIRGFHIGFRVSVLALLALKCRLYPR